MVRRWLKLAVIKDGELVQGEPVSDPAFGARCARQNAGCGHSQLRAEGADTTWHDLYFEWDNAAVVSTVDYVGGAEVAQDRAECAGPRSVAWP